MCHGLGRLLRYPLALLALPALACSFTPPGISGGSNGGDDAGTTAPIDAPVAPDASGCSDECIMDNGDAFVCDAQGNTTFCPVGCDDSGDAARCLQLTPSNGVAPDFAMITSGLTVASGTVTIDTDTGRIADQDGAEIRPAGAGVLAGIRYEEVSTPRALLVVDSLTVESGATLRPFGDRALIVLSRGDAIVRGLINVGGGCDDSDEPGCGGPGGGDGATSLLPAQGCAPGQSGGAGVGIPESGAGGGGLGRAGRRGGFTTSTLPGAGGNPAFSVTCPDETLEPLRGGSGGGRGGGTNPTQVRDGGGGGGGFQLTSQSSIQLFAGAEIWAGGAGGGPSREAVNGGSGGGSGGAILLEAPLISAPSGALITANGGGGGGGGVTAGFGSEGSHSLDLAPGGGQGGGGGGGGPGGAANGAAGNGIDAFDGSGGGGGGVGIIRFNTHDTGSISAGDATVSPAATEGNRPIE